MPASRTQWSPPHCRKMPVPRAEAPRPQQTGPEHFPHPAPHRSMSGSQKKTSSRHRLTRHARNRTASATKTSPTRHDCRSRLIVRAETPATIADQAAQKTKPAAPPQNPPPRAHSYQCAGTEHFRVRHRPFHERPEDKDVITAAPRRDMPHPVSRHCKRHTSLPARQPMQPHAPFVRA